MNRTIKNGSSFFGVKEPSHHTCACGTVQAKDTTYTKEKMCPEPL